MHFPLESLKKFLGRDIVDSLIEWETEANALMTKSRLSDMLLSIYGVNILRDSEFRYQLLKSFEVDDLLLIQMELPSKYRNTDDLLDIARAASKGPWKRNNINEQILRILSYDPEEIFTTIDDDTNPVQVIVPYEKFYELLDYQYIIKQKALHFLNSEEYLTRFVIHMPTGTGKTKTASHIISHHFGNDLKKNGLVVWIAHTNELLHQAYETFATTWRHIGNGDIKIYKLWEKFSEEDYQEDLNGFLLCSIQKLQSMKMANATFYNRIIENAVLIVYDEAHKSVAEYTKIVINDLMTKKEHMPDRSLMGLTATPGRSTTASFDNDLLAMMFENRIIGIDTELIKQINMMPGEALNTDVEHDIIKYFQNRGVLSRIQKEELSYAIDFTEIELNAIKVVAMSSGYDDYSKNALNIIGRNKNRNLRIMQRLRELNEKGIPTIVFACSVEHCKLLSAMLTIESIPNALVIGEMSKIDRNKAISNFKSSNSDVNILINYEVLTTGFDATNIECVFIARPTKSVVLYSQMLGRGLRGPQMGGNDSCLLIDIKDNLEQYNEKMIYSYFDSYWRG